MKRFDVIVVGAGPAGLSAAIQACQSGMTAAVFDENSSPGGQLFKQIHKFFGSKEHRAKIRGFRIGQDLLTEAEACGVQVFLNSTVIGLYDDKEILVQQGDGVTHYKGDAIILATGAMENMIPFEGWTLPGVMGAGAAQTLMNLHGIKPGNRVLMVGSGNVGLVVSYQLLQAGVEVAAVIDAAPHIGGYGVHAAKVSRTGVPFHLSTTVVKAEGEDHVTGAVIARVDEHFKPIPGTETHIDVDTICVAVGLSPMAQLPQMLGCDVVDRGGSTPIVDDCYQTSLPGIYAAGDVAGIEEASSAMITGRIAGLSAAHRLGFVGSEEHAQAVAELRASLARLHEGMFAPQNKGRSITHTDEGCPQCQSLLQHGYIADDDIKHYPGIAGETRSGVHPVIECVQNIPCDPCQDACRSGCIQVGKTITSLPTLNPDTECSGCGLCVAACSGQAIFLVDNDYDQLRATITLPYEFLPLPQAGDKGVALSRKGEALCPAEVVSCKAGKAMDATALLTIAVPKDMSMAARFYRASEGVE